MRECGTCTHCCQGWLTGTVKNITFFPGKPCHFNTTVGCSIYEDRPQFCKDFKCLWLAREEALPEWMRPDRCGVMVVIREWGLEQKPYMLAMECGKKMDSKVLSWLFLYHLGNGIPLAYQVEGGMTHIGPREFVEWVTQRNPNYSRVEM